MAVHVAFFHFMRWILPCFDMFSQKILFIWFFTVRFCRGLFWKCFIIPAKELVQNGWTISNFRFKIDSIFYRETSSLRSGRCLSLVKFLKKLMLQYVSSAKMLALRALGAMARRPNSPATSFSRNRLLETMRSKRIRKGQSLWKNI